MSGGKKVLSKNQKFKRDKVKNARFIRSQAVSYDKQGDLSKESGGLLNVNGFVDSRSFEIRELYSSMSQSKNSNATRVFQSLPRKLRRRTASHNIRRIPKRMRNRARREMVKNSANVGEQSTAYSGSKFSMTKKTVKNRLNAKQFYRAKMSIKLLRLFTKTKNLKILSANDEISLSNLSTRQKFKHYKDLLKTKSVGSKSKPINNDMGSYDNTAINSLATKTYSRIKYLKRQKHFKWLSTHIWHTKRAHMIKRWGYQIPYSPSQKCYKLVHRLGSSVASSDGVLLQDTSFIGNMIIENTADVGAVSELVALLTKKKANKKIYRLNHYYFEGLLYNIDNEDSKIDEIIGPVDILWINEHKVLLRMHPSFYEVVFKTVLKKCKPDKNFRIYDCRYSIGSINVRGACALSALSSVLRTVDDSTSYQQLVKLSKLTDYSVLPKKTIFAFNSVDPRFLAVPKSVTKNDRDVSAEDICSLDNNLDEVQSVLEALSDPNIRNESYNNQCSLKEIHRRKKDQSKQIASQNQNLASSKKDNDPSIPIVIIKRPKVNDWVVLLPWNWILPFWYQLNKITRAFHIGLRQNQQLHFESRTLYFPDDYPFTDIGFKENSIFKRDVLMKKWEAKPKGHRLNYDKIDDIHNIRLPAVKGEIGDYFSCDWLFLQILINGILYLKKDTNSIITIQAEKTLLINENCGLREIRSINDILEFYNDIKVKQTEKKSPIVTLQMMKNIRKHEPRLIDFSSSSPQLAIMNTPLPITPISCTFSEKGHPTDYARIYQIPEDHLEYWKSISNGVYRANGKRNHELTHPKPNVEDLIGYVTSGTFSLSAGRGVANGFVHSQFIQDSKHDYILIRNVGSNVYRVSKWKLINL